MSERWAIARKYAGKAIWLGHMPVATFATEQEAADALRVWDCGPDCVVKEYDGNLPTVGDLAITAVESVEHAVDTIAAAARLQARATLLAPMLDRVERRCATTNEAREPVGFAISLVDLAMEALER